MTEQLRPAEVRALYERAFTLMRTRLRESEPTDSHRLISELLDFRDQRVRWAETDTNSRVMAVEASEVGNGWLIALSMDDPTSKRQAGVVSSDWVTKDVVGVSIRPDRLTAEWAAVVVMNGLEHLAAAMSGREPAFRLTWQHHAEDAHGYEIEVAAADVVSRGRFSRALGAQVRREQWKSWRSVIHLTRPNPASTALIQPLTEIVTTERPASPAELNSRFGLVVIGLGLKAIEIGGEDPEVQMQAKVDFMSALLGPPPRPHKPANR